MRLTKRQALEEEVQSYTGPIMDIHTLSDALLYGMRDEYREQLRQVGEALAQDDAK
jgi:hypothetical protein